MIRHEYVRQRSARQWHVNLSWLRYWKSDSVMFLTDVGWLYFVLILLSVIKKNNYHKTSYADDFTLYWSDVKSSHSSYQWSFNKLWIQTVYKSELIQPLYHCNHWKQHTKITYPGLQDNTHYLWNKNPRNPPYTKFE